MKTILTKESAHEIRQDIPQSSRFSLPSSFGVQQILVALLVIAAFFLGSLYSKVQYLQSQAGTQTGTQNGYGQTAPAAPQQQAQAPAPGQKVANLSLGHYPPKGDKNAKVQIVEYGDLRCPFCQRYFTDTEPQILSDYVNSGKASYYFVDYPFLGPASTVAANAAECANEQGKFWEFHDYMYKNQPSESDTSIYTTDKLSQIAGTLGMDSNQFSSCLSANKYSKNVSDDLAAGQKAGVSGTPTVFVNGVPIVGAQPYTAFQSAINTALK